MAKYQPTKELHSPHRTSHPLPRVPMTPCFRPIDFARLAQTRRSLDISLNFPHSKTSDSPEAFNVDEVLSLLNDFQKEVIRSLEILDERTKPK